MLKSLFIMVRPLNLAMIALTQLLIRFCVVLPVYEYFKIQSSLTNIEYSMVVIATMLIAASGYIINDYFDQSIDSINRPFRLNVNEYWSKQNIVNLHLLFNVAAIVLAFVASWLAGNYKLSFIYVVAAGLLWFYSSTYKKMFLVGNLVVSFLTAIAVLLPALFELPILVAENPLGRYDAVKLESARIILYTVTGYVIFAFITTLIREIVKDAEDIKGDMSAGANTIPVMLGFGNTKILIGALWLVLIGLVGWVSYSFYAEGHLSRVIYLAIAVQLPSLVGLFFLLKANEPENFSLISKLLKAIMFLGVLSMAVFYFMNQA